MICSAAAHCGPHHLAGKRLAQAPEAARIRAAFLQMIERPPLLPLAPEAQPRLDAGRWRKPSASLLRPASAYPAYFSRPWPATIAGRPSSFSTEREAEGSFSL